jgi:hypothetical protein
MFAHHGFDEPVRTVYVLLPASTMVGAQSANYAQLLSRVRFHVNIET